MKVPVFSAVLLLLVPAGPARAVTLRECFARALARNPTLESRRQEVERSQALARAALAGALPRLEFGWADTYQDPHGVAELDAQGFSGFVEKSQTQSQFTVTQPIFSGLKEWSALYGLRRETARDKLLIKSAETALYEETADAFYAVLAAETQKADAQASLELAERRVRDLSEFLKLGKARESEVASARARADALRGTLARVEANVASARKELSRLTGLDESSEPLVDEMPSPPPVPTLDEALGRACGRSDLRAGREDIAAREWRVRYEKGSYFPSINLVGNYYTQRPTFIGAINWDVTLAARLPLFQGGAVGANIKAAEASLRQSRLALDDLKRRVDAEVTNARGDLAGAVEEARALEQAAASARSAYDSLMKEYDLGLVTNLEVLQAQDLLQQQNSARDAARYQAKRLKVRLDAAVEAAP